MNATSRPNLFLRILKWTARVLTTLISLQVLVFAVGYTIGEETSPPTLPAVLLFSGWIFGAGVTWKREGVGGAILMLTTLFALFTFPKAAWPPNPLTLYPIAGTLFILLGIVNRKGPKREIKNNE